MADDGLLLNFAIGTEPLKPKVKFTGGRWRDRKRAQRNARFSSSHPAPSSQGNEDEQNPAAKRRKIEIENPAAKPSIKAGRSTNDGPSNIDPASSRNSNPPKNPGPDSGKGSRQVISSLFSYNPAQVTVAEDHDDWEAPQPSNAPLSSVANFGSLTLSSRLVDELDKMNLTRPTAIQLQVIPHLLSGDSDAFVQAETGSGKTFSYLLPILHRVLLMSSSGSGKRVHRDSGIFAILVSPTRELAKQVHTVLEQLIRPFPWLVSTAITGGESKKAEKARIRKGVNFLVATPGRLADHLDNTKALKFGTVRWLILDEGDRLMDLGFEQDLTKVISALRDLPISKTATDGVSLDALPARRVTVLCSATMKMNVQKLGELSLSDATFLTAKDAAGDSDKSAVHKAPSQLHQSYIVVPSKLRLVTLVAYLRSVFSRRGRTMKAIIFMSCADLVDFHYELLRHSSPPVSSTSLPSEAERAAKTVSQAAYVTSAASPEVMLHRMHGSLSQPVRTATLRSFANCKTPSLLVTTDVSSRGLDIASVDLVIEYDPAFSFADHIHRVGRTARAGRPGDAVLFLLPGPEEGYLELLKSSTPPTPLSYDSVLKTGLLAKLEFPVETSATPSEDASYNDKAESMQLHFEQRLLTDTRLLELARTGFRSHIRAYATHVKDERVHFNLSELHLGHAAKSFGLREAPGGIGAGVERKTKRAPKEASKDQKVEHKDSRDVIRMKSKMLMKATADEFNIG